MLFYVDRLFSILLRLFFDVVFIFFFSSRRRHTRCALVTGVQTCALPICLAGVPMNFPSRWHPAKSVAAMRFCCALEEDQAALARFARGAFASYFDRQENLDDPAVLAAVADAEGLDGAALAEAATGDEIGRAHVCTPVTNAHLVCRLLLE